MLVPRRLKIQGFRGFRDPIEFSFDQPATIFFGENRSGKSSTLNAAEWCLFGDDCVGKQTGMPDAREQQALFHRRPALLTLKADGEHAQAERDAIGRTTRELDIEFGGHQAALGALAAVQAEMAEAQAQLRQANRRAALIAEAIGYLEQTAPSEPADQCPLCAGPAPELLTTLRQQWQEKLQAQVAAIDALLKEMGQRRKKLEAGAARYRELNDRLQRSSDALARCHTEIGKRLGRSLRDEDEPLRVLRAELDGIEERGRKLHELVEGKHQRLEDVEHELRRLRLIHAVLHGEDKQRALEAIQESAAFRALEAARDQVAEWVSDLEAVRSTIAAAAREEAGTKLMAAEDTIDAYFRALTRHPAVPHIRLRLDEARGQRNSYEVTDQDGKDLTPILSQGDLNALALAIFLGLASAGAASELGFVMLDDPSQSLGSEHKKQLVKVLDDVARRKRLLLATMDSEFHALLTEHLHQSRSEYAFGVWGPETGPSVTRGPVP